jgi:hypothetical protein
VFDRPFEEEGEVLEEKVSGLPWRSWYEDEKERWYRKRDT